MGNFLKKSGMTGPNSGLLSKLYITWPQLDQLHNSPSSRARSLSASRVWKPRWNAAWNRLRASGVCAPAPKM
jgi:hypothetical protein